MKILELGTRVIAYGKYGYIRSHLPLDGWYGVEFNEVVPCGHDLKGVLSPDSCHGLFLPFSVIEVIDDITRHGCLLDTNLSVPRASSKVTERGWYCAEMVKL